MSCGFPVHLKEGFLDGYPKLSTQQAGHLRHFHILANQPDGEWHHMGSQDPGQEWLDSYRYQLATMAYAAGAAHYHRLPVLRSIFQSLIDRLISKMLRKEVWGYWFLTSHSGRKVDPDLTELRKPWPNPVTKENIMVGTLTRWSALGHFIDIITQYSGHLLLMVSLYSMLFDDDKFDKESAITFHWNPIFWGMGDETFSYTRSSLRETIIADMERNNWLGVCCEPNCIFVVCNQFPVHAASPNLAGPF